MIGDGSRCPSPAGVIAASAVGGRPVDLAGSYEICRRIMAAHGRTYHLAASFLPGVKQRHVHALYAFARHADDLVDHMDLGWSPVRRRAELERWSAEFLDALARGDSDDPVLKAVVHTVRALGVDHDDLRAFLASMAMDLEVTRYATFEDLCAYMHGSAAVIGTMLLPLLDPLSADARPRAMDLGVAFQLTNFLRDVAEDWDRGRLYLPLEDLDRFGVTEADLATRHVGPRLRRLLAFEVDRTRAVYRRAEEGWALLAPSSRACIRIAHRLYAGILDRIEGMDYQVFRSRASVPAWHKAAVVLQELARAPLSEAGRPTLGVPSRSVSTVPPRPIARDGQLALQVTA